MEHTVITGANGLIGSHIAEYFRGQGFRPLCLVRDQSRAEFLRTLQVDIAQADVTVSAELPRFFEGADLVIHTAAKVSDWGRYEDFHAVNVGGTVNVLRAAIAAGVSHVIITGSNSCYGEENSYEIKNEDSPCHSHYPYFLDGLLPSALNFYRDTKALANTCAMEISESNGLNLTIIEPVWVYGEREFRSGFYEFLKTVSSGIPFFPGSPRNRFHTIYVRDLARLYFQAALARLSGVHRFIACDETAEYQRVLFAMFCREAGLRLPRALPKALVYPPAVAMEIAATLLGTDKSPVLTRAIVNTLYDNIEYSGEKARRILNFTPAYTREESIRNTVAWYRANNLL
jgi:nucleoside-diphosphate-sugar epimerase